MGIDKLKRVLWRLQEMKCEGEANVYSGKQVREAIMEECGTDKRTLEYNLQIMKELKLLEVHGMGKYKAREIDT